MRLLAYKNKKNLKKSIKYLLYSITIFIVLLIFSLYLLFTPLGFTFIISYAKPILSKYNIILHDGKFEGRLSNFSFPGVTVKTKATTTIVKNTHIEWNPFALLIGRLSIQKLIVNNVIVDVNTNKFDHDNKPTTFDFPLKLSSNYVNIKNALVQVDNTRLDYSNLYAKVKLYHNMLITEQLIGDSFKNTLAFKFNHASLNLNSPYHIDANVKYQYHNKKGFKTKQGIGQLIGDFDQTFKLYTKGTIYYNKITAPYNITVSIKHKKISSVINSLKIDEDVKEMTI